MLNTEEYWKERKEDISRTWNRPIPYQKFDAQTTFLKGERIWNTDSQACLSVEEQEDLLERVEMAVQITFGGGWSPFIEVQGEGTKENPSIRFKLRQAYNEPLQRTGVDITTYYSLCKTVRRELNSCKKFKACKVFMLIYEEEPEMTSLNVVYNPHWRRHENFELMYRSQVQLRRARR